MTLHYGVLPNKNYFLQDVDDFEDDYEDEVGPSDDDYNWTSSDEQMNNCCCNNVCTNVLCEKTDDCDDDDEGVNVHFCYTVFDVVSWCGLVDSTLLCCDRTVANCVGLSEILC